MQLLIILLMILRFNAQEKCLTFTCPFTKSTLNVEEIPPKTEVKLGVSDSKLETTADWENSLIMKENR